MALGGNYNYEKGIVRLFTKPDGSFKRKHPAHTPLHEMVHIGIEAIIVSKFALSHEEKERVVDLICTHKLGSIIPDYNMQSLGEFALDDYVNNETIDSLPEAIEKFVADHPR